MGLILALNWKFGIIMLIVLAVITIVSDYIVLGTFTIIAVTPVVFGVLTQDVNCAMIVAAASLIIFIKHIENIKRLMNGTEMGLRKANKGEYRIKK